MNTVFDTTTQLLDYRKMEAFQGEGENSLKDLNETNYNKLVQSIYDQGFFAPMAVWQHEGHNYLLDGHQRLRVLTNENMEFDNTGFDVPVVFIPGDDFKQAKTRLLLIASQYGTITQEGIDAYIAEAELPEAEIYGAVHFDALPMLGQDNEPDVEEDTPPEAAPEGEPTDSQPGDVFQLGRHRLMCGDSTSPEDVGKLMGDQLANLVFTDPPYMVAYHAKNGLNFNSDKYEGGIDEGSAIINDDMNDDDALDFYTKVLRNAYDFSAPDAPIYWFYASRNQHVNRTAFITTDWYPSQTLIWVKESMVFSPGQDFHRMFEPIMFGWKKGESHYANRRINNLKDAFTLNPGDFIDIMDIWLERRDPTQSYVHPTQKPVSLSTRGMRKHCPQGANILDLFGGSGSTLMGAEQLGRNAFIMEMDPRYCDVIRRRWHKFHNNDKDDGWVEATPAINGKEPKNEHSSTNSK